MRDEALALEQRSEWIMRSFMRGSVGLVEAVCDRLVADRRGPTSAEAQAAAAWSEEAERAIAEGILQPHEVVAFVQLANRSPIDGATGKTAGCPPLRQVRARKTHG